MHYITAAVGVRSIGYLYVRARDDKTVERACTYFTMLSIDCKQ